MMPGRVRPAFLFQLTAPGAPGIYYGDEVGLGGGEEPASRRAFPWHDPGSWDRGLLETVRSLAALRRAHPALRLGRWRLRWQGEDAFVFSRVLGQEEILVVVNRGGGLPLVEVPARRPLPAAVGGGAGAPVRAGWRSRGWRRGAGWWPPSESAAGVAPHEAGLGQDVPLHGFEQHSLVEPAGSRGGRLWHTP